MIRTIYHAALASALFVTAQNAVARAQVPLQPSFSGVEQYRLSNGMTVLLSLDHTAPSVAVGVLYRTGSESQQQEQLGAILSTWRTALRTTPMGGATGFEVVPRDQLAETIRLKASQVKGLTSTSDHAFLSSPDAGLWGGSADLVSASALRDVGKFFRDYYSPSNATIVVVGNFDRTATKALIAKHFGSLPSAPEGVRSSGGLALTLVIGRDPESGEPGLEVIGISPP